MTKIYTKLTKLAIVLPCTLFSFTAFADEIVTNTNDAGAGSLREAIIQCNLTPAADVITFNIAGGGPFTISLTSSLPTITQPLTINGYSQPGAAVGTVAARTILVNINGAGIPAGNDIFRVLAPNVTISGLAIYSAPDFGINILLGADNTRIMGNYIGTNNTGTATGLGNGKHGIVSNFNPSSLNFGPPGLLGVIIGTNDDNTNDANEGNLICGSAGTGGPSGNDGDGIFFWNTRSSFIKGNTIGLNKNGIGIGFGNTRNGITLTVTANDNVVGTDGDGTSDALEVNWIGNNGAMGIQIAANSDNNIVAGNTVGLNAAAGVAANGFGGIQLLNSSGNRIGTDGAGAFNNIESNTICGNNGDGIEIVSEFFVAGAFDGDANNNVVAGNNIGTDAAGTLVAGNIGAGVSLVQTLVGRTTSNNIIGSDFNGNDDASEGNRISNNTNGGIVTNIPVDAASGMTGNKFSRNSISNNDNRLGIDLGSATFTSNDDGDADPGANLLYNFPVITSVQVTGSNQLIVTGFSRPGSVIEFYIADAGPNPDPLPGGFTTSFGQGATYLFRAQDDAALGSITDAEMGTTATYTGIEEGSGIGGTRTENRFSFTLPAPPGVTAGSRITALAYSTLTGAGNTSEFGGVFTAVATPVILESFTGRLVNGKVILNWRTSLEINNSHFEVEKSTDGSLYKSIGSVPGKGGINNDYTFTDNDIAAKVIYYRLRQVDIDGRPTNSKIVIIRGDLGALTAKASPNPFGGYLNLSYKLDKQATLQVRIINTAGYVVKTTTVKGNAGLNNTNIPDLNYLPAGNYVLELIGDNISFRQQLIKK